MKSGAPLELFPHMSLDSELGREQGRILLAIPPCIQRRLRERVFGQYKQEQGSKFFYLSRDNFVLCIFLSSTRQWILMHASQFIAYQPLLIPFE